jgi:hypothetical protein
MLGLHVVPQYRGCDFAFFGVCRGGRFGLNSCFCHHGGPVLDIARQHNACIPLSAVFGEAEGRTVHEVVDARRSGVAWRSWRR